MPVSSTANELIFYEATQEEDVRTYQPAMVIQGDQDASSPLALTGKPTAELIPGCRLKVYPGAPHGLMFTHMDMLNADILQFMRET